MGTGLPLDRLVLRGQAWAARHPQLVAGLRVIGRVVSWAALSAAVVAFVVVPDTRGLWLQLLWSQYLLWQFFVLGRTKSLTWRELGWAVLAGGWAVGPVAVLSSVGVHGLLGGDQSDIWSLVGWAALSEEVLKLAPLGLLLWGSRRGRTLGIVDLALVGAATGVGFQLVEEAVRRVVGGLLPYGTPLFGGQVIHWEFWSLFPGQFEVQVGDARMTAGHGVTTALVAVGLGLAVRFRRRWPVLVPALPGILLGLAMVDHAAWNGQDRLWGWVLWVHGLLGAGYLLEPLLLVLLVVAVLVDARDLDGQEPVLPKLPGETRIGPLGELRQVVAAVPAGVPGLANLWAFQRGRRRLGFARRPLLPVPVAGDPGAADVERHRRWLAAAGVVAVVLLAVLAPVRGGPDATAYLAGLLDSLGGWWNGLEWYEQLLVIGAVGALGGWLLGGWTLGFSVAFAAGDVAANGESIARLLRDPRGTVGRFVRDLTPARAAGYAGAFALDRLLRRLPVDELARRVAPGRGRGRGDDLAEDAVTAARRARIEELAVDPVQGVTAKTIREAEVGLEYEDAGRVRGLRRDPTGNAEFVDADGTLWDVKGFRSDFPPEQGGYTREGSMRLIRREVAAGENVMIDTLHMSPEHVTDLRAAVEAAGLGPRVLFP